MFLLLLNALRSKNQRQMLGLLLGVLFTYIKKSQKKLLQLDEPLVAFNIKVDINYDHVSEEKILEDCLLTQP